MKSNNSAPAPAQTATAPNSISVHVAYLANVTTRVALRDGKWFFGEIEERKANHQGEVRFVEFQEKGLKLDVPPRMCSNGHRLELELEFTTPTEKIHFNARGTVSHAEVFPRDHDSVEVTFTQYDEKSWAAVHRLYKTRQAKVLALFHGLKGGSE